MKSRFKKNILREKEAWIEKIHETNQAYFSLSKPVKFTDLPEKVILHEKTILYYVFAILILLIVVFVDYKILSAYADNTNLDFAGLRHQVLTISGGIYLVVAFPLIKLARAKRIKYELTFSNLKYYDTVIQYEDIKGIYAYHEISRTGNTLLSIKIKTKDKQIHNLDLGVKEISSQYIPNILSTYLYRSKHIKTSIQ